MGRVLKRPLKKYSVGNQIPTILADLVHYALPKEEAEWRMLELEELTRTFGGVAVVKSIQRRAKPDYRTFIGKGKVDEIVSDAPRLGAKLLIINEILKPSQIYNLEEALRPVKMKVWDRVDLILNIFDKHASTAEAKLEIDLARLRHMGPRIYNLGDQLGRQRGGTGTRGGSGEGNTEAMKRHLRERERRILEKLETYQGVRNQQLQNRRRNAKKTVALVGYTNAGKTSLLNALTKRKEYAADALFATLDTRVGDMYVPAMQDTVLLSDTIGFIQGLPPALIQAFRSTLSEAVNADVLLHVVDVSDPKWEEKIGIVEGILSDLGVADRPRIRVMNKVDRVHGLLPPLDEGHVFVSAATREGLDELRERLMSMFSPVRV